jgi:hypothetical protein
MNKFTAYQKAVERTLATLPIGPDGEVYTTSLENDQKGTIAGRVGVNTAGVAAMLVVQGTHRAATPDEIENWKADQARKKAESEAAAAKKDNKVADVKVDMGSFMSQFMAILAANQQKEAETVPAAPIQQSTSPKPNRAPNSPAQSGA